MAQLYGGAITAVVPEQLLDGSQFRPVPDTQEVFVGDVDGHDVSLVVDLCEQVDPGKPLIEAAQTHVDDVHHMAGNATSELLETDTVYLNEHETVLRLEGVKGAKQGAIALVFALFRLKKFETDVFVTYMANVETARSPEFSSFLQRGRKAVEEFVSSFQVHDPNLFQKSEA